MTEKQVYEMVNEIGFNAAYHHFEEGQEPQKPYLVYLYPGSNNFSADGMVYQDINKLNIELYTDNKDPEAEKRVEAVLKKHGLFYETTESYIKTEGIYEVLFEMEVLLNE